MNKSCMWFSMIQLNSRISSIGIWGNNLLSKKQSSKEKKIKHKILCQSAYLMINDKNMIRNVDHLNDLAMIYITPHNEYTNIRTQAKVNIRVKVRAFTYYLFLFCV